MHHTIGALSAFIIGIAGGDNVTLQHLDHLIAWEDPEEKQQTLTAQSATRIRYQVGKPYLSDVAPSSAPSAKAYTDMVGGKNFVIADILPDNNEAQELGCAVDKAIACNDEATDTMIDAKTGLSQADIDKRVKELAEDNSTMYFASDNKPMSDDPLKDYNRLTTVYFFINSPTTIYNINTDKLIPSKPVYLLGFASPDGEAPRLQTDLATARANHIKTRLEKLGYRIAISGAALCNRCWQVEIYQ
jgi:hypothetical protein